MATGFGFKNFYLVSSFDSSSYRETGFSPLTQLLGCRSQFRHHFSQDLNLNTPLNDQYKGLYPDLRCVMLKYSHKTKHFFKEQWRP